MSLSSYWIIFCSFTDDIIKKTYNSRFSNTSSNKKKDMHDIKSWNDTQNKAKLLETNDSWHIIRKKHWLCDSNKIIEKQYRDELKRESIVLLTNLVIHLYI